jgi:Zn-dependent protease
MLLEPLGRVNQRFKIFTIFGFEVRLHSSWLVLAILVAWSLAVGYFPHTQAGLPGSTYWIMGIVGVAGLLFSIVFHEFFHSIVARYFKLPMDGITLFIFGGIAEMKDEPPTPKVEALMAVAGPLASLALWFGFGVCAQLGLKLTWSHAVNAVLVYLSHINLILAVFNMIPAYPLDGGRILRAALWAAKKDLLRGTKIAQQIGSGFGILLVVLGFVGLIMGQFVAAIWWILMGLFINFAAQSSRTQLQVRELLKDESLARFVNRRPRVIDALDTVQAALQDFIYRFKERLFPVVWDGRLVGCVGLEEVRHVAPHLRSTVLVKDILVPCAQGNTIDIRETALNAYRKMTSGRYQLLLVMDHSQFVGVLRLQDLLEYLALKYEVEEGHRLVHASP